MGAEPIFQQTIDKADPATTKRLEQLINLLQQQRITLSQFVNLWDEVKQQSLSYVKKKQSGLPVGTGPTPEGALQEAQIKRFKLLERAVKFDLNAFRAMLDPDYRPAGDKVIIRKRKYTKS